MSACQRSAVPGASRASFPSWNAVRVPFFVIFPNDSSHRLLDRWRVAGYYGATGGMTTATCTASCQPGNYAPSGSTQCTKCAAGTFAASAASASCGQCGPGTYSLTGATTCTACPAGTYGATGGQQTAACSGQCQAGTATHDVSVGADRNITHTGLCTCVFFFSFSL